MWYLNGHSYAHKLAPGGAAFLSSADGLVSIWRVYMALLNKTNAGLVCNDCNLMKTSLSQFFSS